MDEIRPSFSAGLVAGDFIVILLITITGFITHGEGSAVFRMFTTLIPLCIGWGLAAVILGLFRIDIAGDFRQIWKPIAAALLGVPLAAWLRGMWLNSPILPIFILVLFSVTAVAMLIWRGAWMFAKSRQVRHG